MEPVTDEPDESRPAKRVRLEAPLEISQNVQEEIVDDDDWDDVYATGPVGAADTSQAAVESAVAPTEVTQVELDAPDVLRTGAPPIEHTLPDREDPLLPIPGPDGDNLEEVAVREEIEDALNPAVVEDYTDLRAQGTGTTDNSAPLEVLVDINAHMKPQVEPQAGDLFESKADEGPNAPTQDNIVRAEDGIASAAQVMAVETHNAEEHTEHDTNASKAKPKPAEDPEFLAAAAAQQGNEQAEWHFDASDAESSDSDSSSDDSSDSDSDSGSEGGYEMLDPATAAKILMSGDGDDDDGDKSKNKSGGDHQPRTLNEVKEEVVPKPNVIVTEDMKITYLGVVEGTVGGLMLVKAVTPGEYQVLESGSVLCKESREVIGVVAETLGRVQQPMYSVAFTNAKEIEDLGLEHGTKLYYVNDHSTFVFTQPLKNMKGTDASNLHDEEVGEDELEFSDDEAEAEYKRQKKLAKRGGRGALSRSAFNQERETRSFRAPGFDGGVTYIDGGDAPQQQYGGALAYDDGDVQEEFYSPLKRPDNLSQLMAGAVPQPQAGQFGRGRGRGRGDRGDRGRGRGRGDRGRGRGNFDQQNQRGGRGAYGQDRGNRGGQGRGQQNPHRGSAHTFPDRHNDDASNGYGQASLPPKPPVHQSLPPTQHSPQFQGYQQYHHDQQPTSPQAYQFNGYTFQYGHPSQPQVQQNGPYNQQQFLPNPAGSIPPGAYVNPAFYQNQYGQPQAALQQQYQQQHAGWPQQQAVSQYDQSSPYGGPQQQQQQQQQNNPNLAEILRQFGGQPQR